MDMANMKSSFDDLHSEAPGSGGLDMDTGADSFNDIDSGLHENATKSLINRMDQTNQERMEKLNSMFPPPSKLMPKFHKKKKSHVISIKKMLKNYPPGLVDEFMPELKEKVMHKFNEMRKNDRMNRRIRKLKRKLENEKRRRLKRRKLREKRRRKALARRRRRRLHHHHHHHPHHLRRKHHFRPHFSMKAKNNRFHSIGVINNFMHHRHNHLNHLHHLKERRLQGTDTKSGQTSQISMVLSNETDSENQFLALEKELENGNLSTINESNASKGKRQESLTEETGSNSAQTGASINTSKLVEEVSKVSGTTTGGSNLSDQDEDALGDVSTMIEQNDSAKSITGGVSLPSIDDPIAKDSAKSGEKDISKPQSIASGNEEVSMTVSPDSSNVQLDTDSQKTASPVEMESDKSNLELQSEKSLDRESFDKSQPETSLKSQISDKQLSVGSQSMQQLDEVGSDKASTPSEISQMSKKSEIESSLTPDVSAKSVISEFGEGSPEFLQKSTKSGDTIQQVLTDEDALEETLDSLSKKEDNLEDQLSKLEQMSNVGQLDEEDIQDQKSTISSLSGKSPSISPMTSEKQIESLSTHSGSVDIEQIEEASTVTSEKTSLEASPVKSMINIDEIAQKSHTASEEFSEPLVGMDRSHVSGTSQKDIETVITDENDKPLTEQDKEIILDELEGKPVKTDIHINHKSIESLHHINVYHYLPPKFIAAGSMPYGYPGMPQQPPMTPGPIINIHNSTTSSGGGTNNAYDVGPDGKLHAMASGPNGQVVVSNPTPTQNWGQVVYSNNHHGVSAGAVSTISQPPIQQPNVQSQLPVQTEPTLSNLVSQPIQQTVDQTPLTIESMTPNIVTEKPIIEAQNIKVEPIVNTEVINKSPINAFTEDQVQHSELTSEVSSMKSVDVDEQTFVNHSPSHFANPSVIQNPTNQADEFNASELSDFDEETVIVDPDKVNNEDGQSVTLGGEQSEENLDNKSILII